MPHPTLSQILVLVVPLWTACASAPSLPEARSTASALLESDAKAAAAYLDALDPDALEDTPIQLLRAEAAARSGDLAEAVRRYTEVADHTFVPRLRDQALHNLAVVLLQWDQPEEAYAALRRSSPEALKDQDVQRKLGVVATAAGRLDLARTHFKHLTEAEQQRIARVLGPDFLTNR